MIGRIAKAVGVPGWAVAVLMLAGVGGVFGLAQWWHGRAVAAVRREARAEGVAAERASWQAARRELLARRQAAVAARETALVGTLAGIRRAQEREGDALATLLARRPDDDRRAVCFDDELVHAIEAARAAVRSAGAAGQRGGAVPGQPGAAAAGNPRGDGGVGGA